MPVMIQSKTVNTHKNYNNEQWYYLFILLFISLVPYANPIKFQIDFNLSLYMY